MPQNRHATSRSARRAGLPMSPSSRRANPSCRGGASSLLRVSQAAAARLPNGAQLAQWASAEDDRIVLAVTGPLGEFRSGSSRAVA